MRAVALGIKRGLDPPGPVLGSIFGHFEDEPGQIVAGADAMGSGPKRLHKTAKVVKAHASRIVGPSDIIAFAKFIKRGWAHRAFKVDVQVRFGKRSQMCY
jgi:hypothetical protein